MDCTVLVLIVFSGDKVETNQLMFDYKSHNLVTIANILHLYFKVAAPAGKFLFI